MLYPSVQPNRNNPLFPYGIKIYVGSHGLPEEDRPRLCPKCRQCKHPPHRHSHYERRVINYNIDSASLFPLIFVGQPELRKLLWLKKYEATVQHIGMQYHLCGMSKEETSSYIRHHMTVSRTEKPVFAESALSWIFAASQGLPRLVNQICTQILLDAAPVIWK